MTATVRRTSTAVVLAFILLAGGVRCGDTYFPDSNIGGQR